jgi:hypothetical protein
MGACAIAVAIASSVNMSMMAGLMNRIRAFYL